MEFVDIVAAVLEAEPDDIADTAGPATLPAWTSLRHLQLIVTLEEAYGVSFSYQEIRRLKCIGELRRALQTKRAIADGGVEETGARPPGACELMPVGPVAEQDGHPFAG